MSNNNLELDDMMEKLEPILLPPADYPPAAIVRDTPRDELIQRIHKNAEETGFELTGDHLEVINFLFDFYTNCCEHKDPGYIEKQVYWKYVDKFAAGEDQELDGTDKSDCQFGQLSASEAIKANRVYYILAKAFKDKGGKKYLFNLFPHGPLFSIHYLAQLPRLHNEVEPGMGVAY